MLNKLTCFAVITGSMMINPAMASLEGIDVTVQNTIQSPSFTGGVEVPFGDPQTVTISSTAVELPSFIDAYDVDFGENSISFNWVDTEFSQLIGGPVGADVFDRNFFIFGLPEDEIITSFSFDALNSNLLSGSALPSAHLLSSNEVLTIFGEGVIRELGFNPVFNVTTSTVPAPATLLLVGTGLIGVAGMRKNRSKLSGSLKNCAT